LLARMTANPITKVETDCLMAPVARFGRMALAVSGGPDSLALLHLGGDFARRHGLAAPVVLTVDHDLRPGSRAEAETVARLAEELELPHAILTWRHGPIRNGLQAIAREARYDLMAAYCSSHNIPALATAHHLDDQAETFLMRLKRGSGLDGLAAIPEEGNWSGLTLLRPLLDVPKARLIATTTAAGLSPVSDPSNIDPRFERVRLRGAMAMLAELGLTPEAIALSARRLRRARSALEATVDAFLNAHSERSPAGYASVSMPALLTVPEDVGLRALARLVVAVGGSNRPVRLAKLEALFEGLRASDVRAQTLGRCQILPVDDRLAVFREHRTSSLPKVKLPPGHRLLWDNRFCIDLGDGEPEPVTVEALGKARAGTLANGKGGLQGVPRLAACTMPACRFGDGRVLLPDLGLGGVALEPRRDGGFDCRATFLWGVRSV
jgi:tRNA(Ile)-lysidine synthase